MSDPLDDNLKALKRDYDGLKYPGDLASEVPLDTRRSGSMLGVWGKIGPVLAMAAAVALGVSMYFMWPGDITTPQQASLPDRNPATEEIAVAPEAPEDWADSVSSLATLAVPESTGMELPSWTDVTTSTGLSSASTVSIPYQAISVPSVSEIDQALNSQEPQSATWSSDQSL